MQLPKGGTWIEQLVTNCDPSVWDVVCSGTEKGILEGFKDNVVQYNSTIIILVLASVQNSSIEFET